MLERLHTDLVRSRLGSFPAVALLGPRQCGKTTLARSLEGLYFDLEQRGDGVRLDAQWEDLMSQTELLILDEAQEIPELFPRLRGAIDADRGRPGRFLLLGSVSPTLIQGISESLAGRLAIVDLSPLVLPEIGPDRLDDLWLFGGFPDGGILDDSLFGAWQDSYLRLLAERDLPRWGLPAKPQVTERLIRMLAALQGQSLNASQLGSALGLDSKTVSSYCDFLEGAYLIRRLPPFHAKIRKRLVKSPKLFWRDGGLLHSVMGVQTLDELLSRPWVGHDWEAFVIEQILSTLAATGQRVQAYHFRTSDSYELDLVMDWGSERWAIEVKLTSDPSVGDVGRLEKTADLIDAARRVLICRSARVTENEGLLVTHLADFLSRLTSR